MGFKFEPIVKLLRVDDVVELLNDPLRLQEVVLKRVVRAVIAYNRSGYSVEIVIYRSGRLSIDPTLKTGLDSTIFS